MALAGGGGRFRGRDTRGPQIRINHRIRVPEVRVVDADGSNLGVLPTEAALRRAQEAGLDLVEVNPKASPPVCKILDFGKYKYEEKKRASEAKKKQTIVEVKEVKIRPKTDDHDIDVKVRAIRRFIESGNKVKVTCRFRGREIMHPQRAQMQFDVIVKRVEDVANIEQRPTMEARTMALLLAPKPIVFQRLTSLRAQQERERAQQKARGEQPRDEDQQAQDNSPDEDEDLEDEDDEEEDEDDEDESDDEADNDK